MKIRSHLAMLSAYKPVEPLEVLSARLGCVPEAIVKLDANENPYGPSPRVRQALAELQYAHVYPDPESRSLRAALAAFSGVPAEYLLAGAGVDELIDLSIRVLVEPGEKVLVCPPTFEMYATHTRLNAGQVVEAPRREDFSLDLEAIRKAVETYRPKAFFLPTPNNPDGSLPAPETIDALLELPTLVVLDEAYIEFTGQGRLGEGGTRLRQVPERNNLIVMRTFSKWAGLAGLRVGYGAFPQWLMPTLWKAKQPYNVSVAASAAAIASLEDADYLADTVNDLMRERERLLAGLSAIPSLQPYPTSSNFILCRIPGGWGDEETAPGRALKDYLCEYGILIRYFEAPRLRDHVRISVGTPEDTDRLLEALKNRP
ncbi:MAG: histidinol-phosphate transaminase [Chloroflexota bacterium]